MRVTSPTLALCFIQEGSEWWEEFDEPELNIDGKLLDNEITIVTWNHDEGDRGKLISLASTR